MPGREAYRVEGWCPCAEEPPRSDDEYFEALTAAVFQMRFRPAIVRARWPAIRTAFADFTLATVASWPDAEVERLLGCPGMIRNRKKILATLRNARQLAERARAYGSVRAYLEHFRPDSEALMRELDGWVHYLGAPSLRWFLDCVGLIEAWASG